jgi:carbonic anhydrase
VNEIVKENAKITADLLRQQSEIIRGAVESGKITIIPAYYNLKSGKVDFYEPISVKSIA